MAGSGVCDNVPSSSINAGEFLSSLATVSK